MAYSGKALRALREEKQIQLRRISDETRINIWYLSAIEEERFDRFPGSFYFKSFTREYARTLGLDPGEVLSDLEPAYREWSDRQVCAAGALGRTPPGLREAERSRVSEGFIARFRGWSSVRRRNFEV